MSSYFAFMQWLPRSKGMGGVTTRRTRSGIQFNFQNSGSRALIGYSPEWRTHCKLRGIVLKMKMNNYSRTGAVKILFRIYWTTDKTMLKSIAHQNPFTSKPWTTLEARSTNTALMTKVKSPNVRMLIGSVIRIRKGLTRVLIMPRKRATKSAEKRPLTVMPGIRYAAMPIERVIINHLSSNIIGYSDNTSFIIKFVGREHPQRKTFRSFCHIFQGRFHGNHVFIYPP